MAFDWKVVAVSDDIVFAVIVESFSLASEVRVYCDLDGRYEAFPVSKDRCVSNCKS